jgi:hypothetical protein
VVVKSLIASQHRCYPGKPGKGGRLLGVYVGHLANSAMRYRKFKVFGEVSGLRRLLRPGDASDLSNSPVGISTLMEPEVRRRCK